MLLMEIHIGADPMDDLLPLVPKWRNANVKPSITFIKPLQSDFFLQLLASSQRLIPLLQVRLSIIWVNRIPRLLKYLATVLTPIYKKLRVYPGDSTCSRCSCEDLNW